MIPEVRERTVQLGLRSPNHAKRRIDSVIGSFAPNGIRKEVSRVFKISSRSIDTDSRLAIGPANVCHYASS